MGRETEEQQLQRVMQHSLKQVQAMTPPTSVNNKPVVIQDNDYQVMQTLNAELIKFEPLNPDQRVRINYEPVGLKNIGNSKYNESDTKSGFIACYFASLIQSYFYIPEFTIKILDHGTSTGGDSSRTVKSSNFERERACLDLTSRLAGLFSKMALSAKKYTEPSEVLKALVDDFGQPMLLGDQKDIGEFNLNFLERLEEGMGERGEERLFKLSPTAPFEDAKDQIDRLLTRQSTENSMRKSSIIDDTETTDASLDSQRSNVDSDTKPQSSIFGLFFGKLTQILKVLDSERTKVINNKVQKMGPIMLDVGSYSNVYEAWNGQQFEMIEDFNSRDVAASFYQSAAQRQSQIQHVKNPKCQKETWISILPKVLIFSLNRVQYDLKKQCLVKNCKKFEFEKTIYADQFMIENKNSDREMEDKVKALRERQRVIKEMLEQYSSFYKGLQVKELLSVTRSFIENQTEDFEDIQYLLSILNSYYLLQGIKGNQDDQQDMQPQPINLCKSPTQIGKLGLKHDQLDGALSILAAYEKTVDEQVRLLELQLQEVDDQISKVYNQLKQNPYSLHAILVHEGTTEQGHYYSFVFDRKAGLWYRFNDYRVTVECEDVVFAESFGDPSSKSKSCAYGIIYVNKEIAAQQEMATFQEFNVVLSQSINPELTKAVKLDNHAFNIELTNFQVDKISKSIKNIFVNKCENACILVQRILLMQLILLLNSNPRCACLSE